MQAIRAGARFIATNEDATYPTPDGPIPGCGSLVAAFAAASGVAPIVAGKPHEPMAAVVQRVLGSTPGDIMVGDRPDTDGLFASRLGCRFGLVMSGVTTVEDLPVHPTPNIITADFAVMVDQLMSAG
jgi:ribonucleotide monophosphatase NagD (HAD superfamily)